MPENIKVEDGNFSLGPDPGFFYTVSRSANALFKIEADGDVVESFTLTLSQFRNPILELHYDGTFFWTLEALPSSLGMVVKKFRLHPHPTAAFPAAVPSEFRWQDEITLINGPGITYESEAFAVEHYHLAFTISPNSGASTFRVDDVSQLELGDTLYLGPSTSGAFVGNEEEIVISAINVSLKSISFLKPGGLENSYVSSDPLSVTKAIWLFNDHSFSKPNDNRGTLLKFELPSKLRTIVVGSNKYSNVSAADFDQTLISFVRGLMIMTLDVDPITNDIQSSLEANLLEADQYTFIKVSDLISDLDNDIYYKLQQKETVEVPKSVSSTITFANDKFNFQTQTTLPVVNSVAVSFLPTRFSITSASVKTRGFTVFAEVRDQFNFPVLAQTVKFVPTTNVDSDPGTIGSLTPTIDFTNVSGIASSVYTPSATETDLLMDISAEVNPV